MDTTWRERLAREAGFFDGEGYVGFQRPKGNTPRVAIGISQKDRFVLDRFRDVVGLGEVYGPYGTADPKFYYQVQGYERIQAIIGMLWLFLGPMKRAQARAVLLQARRVPSYAHACRRGHARVLGTVCRQCKRDHDKAFRTRHPDLVKARQYPTEKRRVYMRAYRERRIAHALLVAV